MSYRRLIVTWAILQGLLLLCVAAVQFGSGPLPALFSLGCATVMAGLILTVFMALDTADTVLRLFAIGGVLWLVFLLLLVTLEVLSR